MMVFALLFTFSFSALAFADESGFVVQGTRHATWRDGKKVGQTYAEYAAGPGRALASTDVKRDPGNWVFYYFETGTATCFYDTDTTGDPPKRVTVALNCVRR